jgi:hypothetical protein
MLFSMYTSYAYITNTEAGDHHDRFPAGRQAVGLGKNPERERLTNAINRVAGNERQ